MARAAPFDFKKAHGVAFDPHALKIYVDGNCWKNPGGPGGFAARVEYPFDWFRADEHIGDRGYFATKNNRMELQACVFAHEWALKHIDELNVQRIQVITDSKYVSDGYGYVIMWAQNDYCSRDGRPIKNVDLWKDVMRLRRKLARRLRIEVQWIQGKSSEITIEVDQQAKKAGTMPTRVDRGFQAGKIGRPKNNSKKGAKLYPATGQTPIIRPYTSGIARRRLQIFKFEVYDEARMDFFDKFEAYAEPSVGNDLHRMHVYHVRMNDILRFPQILEILAELKESDLVAKPAASTT